MQPLLMLAAAGTYLDAAVRGLYEDELARPTPCAYWTVADLLLHVSESLDVLRAIHNVGHAEVRPLGTDAATLEQGIRTRTAATVHAAYAVDGRASVNIADLQLPEELLLAVTALEMGVHGWDIVQARGIACPMPEDLAADLLHAALKTVPAADRGDEFGSPSPTTRRAAPTQKLLAWLGRAGPHPD